MVAVCDQYMGSGMWEARQGDARDECLRPGGRPLVPIFSATVADHPDAPALDHGAEMLTYNEFEASSRVLAAEVPRLGIGRGDRVGVRPARGCRGVPCGAGGALRRARGGGGRRPERCWRGSGWSPV